jgi:DNA polymerase III epsilon subunit-like protein
MQMTDRVMVDIETLGLKPGAAILSIGAVRFDESGTGEEFHRSISLESCQEAGLTIHAGTLEWWLSQDDEVSDILTGGDDLEHVLRGFDAFYGDADEVWANSPSFDCEMLAAAYDAVGMNEPWEFWAERDVRTLKKLSVAPDIERQDGENEHDALDDARHQALLVGETLRRLEVLDG